VPFFEKIKGPAIGPRGLALSKLEGLFFRNLRRRVPRGGEVLAVIKVPEATREANGNLTRAILKRWKK
jgi:hypothetical protein